MLPYRIIRWYSTDGTAAAAQTAGRVLHATHECTAEQCFASIHPDILIHRRKCIFKRRCSYLVTLCFFKNFATQLLQGRLPSHLVFRTLQRSQLAQRATAGGGLLEPTDAAPLIGNSMSMFALPFFRV